MMGKQILELEEKIQSAGTKFYQWNGSDSNGKRVCSGIYFFQIKAGNNTEVIKMILIK